MDFGLLSSDVSQQREDDQCARKRVIRSHTRQSRGSRLVAYNFPELDGRLQGFHVYTGHLSKFKSQFPVNKPPCVEPSLRITAPTICPL